MGAGVGVDAADAAGEAHVAAGTIAVVDAGAAARDAGERIAQAGGAAPPAFATVVWIALEPGSRGGGTGRPAAVRVADALAARGGAGFFAAFHALAGGDVVGAAFASAAGEARQTFRGGLTREARLAHGVGTGTAGGREEQCEGRELQQTHGGVTIAAIDAVANA